MSKNEKRFERIFKEGQLSGDNEIWLDKETGVCYLWHGGGYSGGLTPLLGADGKPVVMGGSRFAEINWNNS